MGGWLYVIVAVVCTTFGFIICAVISGNKYSDYEDKINELNDQITQQTDMVKYYKSAYENIKTNNKNNGGNE